MFLCVQLSDPSYHPLSSITTIPTEAICGPRPCAAAMAASVSSVSALYAQLGAHDKPALPSAGDRLCTWCGLPKSKTPWARSGQEHEYRRCCFLHEVKLHWIK